MLRDMAGTIRFHFDFISPYGYFASLRIEALAQRHGRTVEWCPMLLGVSVLKVMGLKPLLDTPLKGDYIRHDVRRHARRDGVPLGRDLDAPVMNPLPTARALCWAKRHHPASQAALVHAIYAACWGEGRDLSTPQDLASLSVPGLAGEELAAAAAGEEAAQLLRDAVQASLAAGIFGSPTFEVDGELFWGVDRLGDLDDWLTSGGW